MRCTGAITYILKSQPVPEKLIISPYGSAFGIHESGVPFSAKPADFRRKKMVFEFFGEKPDFGVIKSTFLIFLNHFWKFWAQIRDQWRIWAEKCTLLFEFYRINWKMVNFGFLSIFWNSGNFRIFFEKPIEFKKKSTFFSSNSSLITNLLSEFSKIIQKYEKSRFYHSKILKITEKPTNLKKSQWIRRAGIFLRVDSWSANWDL